MIIKSKSYKSNKTFKTLVNYIFRGIDKEKDFLFTKFIRGDKTDEQNITRQLRQNETYRKTLRSNSIKMYMEIISFHKKDKKFLTKEVLTKIAREYVKERSRNSVAVSVVHRDKDHVHLHILLSGVEYKTGDGTRKTKEDFKNLKLHMEELQKNKFPQLSHSVIQHDKNVKKK